MKQSTSLKVLTWIGVAFIVGLLVTLVFLAPWVAAVLFVVLAVITVGNKEKTKSVIAFLKDLLFSW